MIVDPGPGHERLASDVGASAAASLHEAFADDERAALARAGLAGAAVQLTGDVPHVRAGALDGAAADLARADLVLGVASDGGTWLVATREPVEPRALRGDAQPGTPDARAAVLAHAAARGWRVRLAEPMRRVATLGDLAAVAPALDPRGRTRPVFAAILRAQAASLELPPPSRLHLEVTNRCNSLCVTCIRTFDPEPERDLTVAELERLLDELPGLRSVALQVNGEPLLHPQLPGIVRLFAARGVEVELNTNALTLRRAQARALLAAGPDRVNVSLDALDPAAYRRLRGVDGAATVVDNLRAFLAARGPRPARPRVSIWTLASRAGLADLPRLVELAGGLGVDEVYVQRLVVHRRGDELDRETLHGRLGSAERVQLVQAQALAAELGVALRASGWHAVDRMLLPDAASWRGCRRPWESAVVMASGDVVPCCIATFTAPRGEIRQGNVLERGLLPVWNGPAYHEFRAQVLAGDRPACCTGCGDRWSL